MSATESQILDYLKVTLNAQVSSASKYVALSNAIKLAVEEKILPPESNLPSERKMADFLGVSRITVRNSINALASAGTLVRRQGAKTSVANKVRKNISNLIGFSEDIRSRGMRPGMRVLRAETAKPTDLEREKLQLNDGEEVVRMHRIRLANDRPIAIEVAVLPLSVVKSPDALGPSLYASLDAMGVLPDNGIQRISAETLNAVDAELLETRPGTPILVVERCCKTVDGKPIEYTITQYNAEIFDFVNELQR
ncbi:GntR family transcriptional regulator [Parasedimentitalea psychrophila]|uniref:GntR family transcriptional regulator n=1 Tax=Parasedimentitalea psychrophila TaxID=2997337 RepID=A0A9Y2KWT3_9RHOB|nr:GntR family transcriptional regulator [Parasedimentitalea psychrophila]WIY24575.1 GntR family transcriptional regulator [Parasedimentitalea psychrophila]